MNELQCLMMLKLIGAKTFLTFDFLKIRNALQTRVIFKRFFNLGSVLAHRYDV